MRILVSTPDYPPMTGGIQLLAAELATGMADAEVDVITLGGGRAEPHYEAPVSRRIDSPLGVSKLGKAGLSLATIAAGLRRRPDVVLALHSATSPGCLAVARTRRVPLALYFYADEARTRPSLARFAIARADVVIAISAWSAELARGLGCPPEKLRVVLPGVEPPIPGAAAPGIPTPPAERPTVITVARLVPRYKGHDVMLEAIAELREEIPEIEWVVIGDGPLKAELERESERRGLTGNISLLGSVDAEERDRRLSEAHVFAMPSRLPPEGGGEGFGIVYLEAGRFGVPSVAGNVGGATDAVLDGKTGLLVDPADPGAVAGALRRLLTDGSLRERLGRAAWEWAAELSWESRAAQVRQLLVELAS